MSDTEEVVYPDPGQMILDAPIPLKWKFEALPLFLSVHDMKRIFAWQHLYEQILPIHGEILEFGVGMGRDINILCCLRALMEPNVPRRVIGFDTFSGTPAEDVNTDMDGPKSEAGYYGFDVEPQAYLEFLASMLQRNIPDHPSSDRSPVEFYVGKVQDTLPKFLEENQTAVSMVMFDMCNYDATKFALEAIRERLPRGAIVVFNQLKTPYWSGEIRALRETLGISGVHLLRNPMHRYWGYVRL